MRIITRIGYTYYTAELTGVEVEAFARIADKLQPIKDYWSPGGDIQLINGKRPDLDIRIASSVKVLPPVEEPTLPE